MNIKEIALKIANEYDKREIYFPYRDDLANFAEALIAELAKQNEPVAYRWKEKGRWLSWYVDWTWHDKAKSLGFPVEYAYTFPPTAEQIANETSWQPIETAPKGGRFLTTTKLSNGSFGQVGISHSFFCYEVNTRDWKIAGDDPCATHWMPLPTPPKQSMEGV